jgi:hypothetical protein
VILMKCYDPSQRILEQIAKAFTYHPPKGDQPERYVAIREHALGLAQLISALTPESREQSLALTKLDEVVMFSNAAIARHE